MDQDVPTNAYGKGSLSPGAAFYYGHLAPKKRSRSVEDLVGVAMLSTSSVRV